MLPPQEQRRILSKGAQEIIPADAFERKLQRAYETNTPLIVKEGFDATAPEIHLGHAITIRKLRDFQRLGHQVVFLIGDFTGMIGDPSGRSETRKRMTREEVAANARTYQQQVFKILDPDATRVEFNSKWLAGMQFPEVLDLASRYTVARLLERDDFQKRFRNNLPISVLELLYPLVQAFDSVALKADVEIGGTDQKFNLLVGRDIQREFGQEPQVVLTMPILPGTDGVEKMSKSLGNHIGIQEPPDQMFGKIMSIPDTVLEQYLLLVSDLGADEVTQRTRAMQAGELNPVVVKRELGRDVVRQFHGEAAAPEAEMAFDRLFVRRQAPEEMAEHAIRAASASIVEVIVGAGLAPSNGEARRLVRQGAVTLDGRRIEDDRFVLRAGETGEGVLRVGKRRFARVVFVTS